MPARRLSRKRVSKSKSLDVRKLSMLVIVVFVFFVLFIIFFLNRSSLWNGKDRLTIVMPDSDGNVTLVVLDPRIGELTRINIPKNTEVSVARGMGDWKIGSVWQLGVQEKLSGRLLADTVTKSLRMTVDAWLPANGNLLIDGSILRIGDVLATSNSNLNVSDKIKVVIFALKTTGKGRVNVKLEETGYLEEVRLTDGEYGYKVKKTIPTKLVKLFYIPEITTEHALVKVNDSSEGSNARNIADVVQVLGAKVVSIENADVNDVDCVVRGAKKATAKYIARAFSCKFLQDDLSDEVVIEFGRGFDKRF
jgi:hypothetical protein